jgi:hypothetical protein
MQGQPYVAISRLNHHTTVSNEWLLYHPVWSFSDLPSVRVLDRCGEPEGLPPNASRLLGGK